MWICGGCMFVVCVFPCTLYAFDSFRYKGCERRNAYLLTVLSPVRAKWIVLVLLDDKSLFRHIRESHGRRDARNIRFCFFFQPCALGMCALLPYEIGMCTRTMRMNWDCCGFESFQRYLDEIFDHNCRTYGTHTYWQQANSSQRNG